MDAASSGPCDNRRVEPADVFSLRAIGVVRSPLRDKVDAPRQPRAAAHVEGTIELRADLAHAVEDLEGFEHVWVLAYMDRAVSYRPKILPPRSHKKRGVLATRAPHRPNPIALSVLALLGVEGTVLRVRGLDLLDGTPVLDVKPYIPWTDAIVGSRVGWLEEEASRRVAPSEIERPADPLPAYSVTLAPRARAQLDWLEAHGVSLEETLRTVLETSPHPHPYRRIRAAPGGGFVLALHAWRFAFEVRDAVVHVREVRSGYRPKERALHPLHQALDRAFTDGGAP